MAIVPSAAAARAPAATSLATTVSMPPPMCTLPSAPASPAHGVLPPVPPPAVSQVDVDRLRARSLVIPVVGVAREDLHDSFADVRDVHVHEAIDLAAALGTPVVAIEDGTIAKLFLSDAGGLTIYQLDPSATYVYYYAHLDRYADGLHEGQAVVRGQVIAYVGTTGNAGATPHLHFAILKQGPEQRWWEGSPVNPYLVLRGVD